MFHGFGAKGTFVRRSYLTFIALIPNHQGGSLVGLSWYSMAQGQEFKSRCKLKLLVVVKPNFWAMWMGFGPAGYFGGAVVTGALGIVAMAQTKHFTAGRSSYSHA